jgi:plasmid maintenance system antidote protein VapI
MSASFGPQDRECAALIERARRLTTDELQRLIAAWGTAREATWVAREAAYEAAHRAAYGATCDAARLAARGAAWRAAFDAARDASFAPAREAAYVARDAACDASRALIIRDLIGQLGFTRAHYDELTGPWRRAIGPLHPDDAVLDGAS